MSNYLASDTDLTSVANAIRTKGGTSAQLAFPAGFVSAIDAIPTGGGDDPDTLTIKWVTSATLYHETGMPVKYKLDTPLLRSLNFGWNGSDAPPSRNAGIEEIVIEPNSQTDGCSITARHGERVVRSLKRINFNNIPISGFYQCFQMVYGSAYAPYFESALGLNFSLCGGANYKIGQTFEGCAALKNVTLKPNCLGQLDLKGQSYNWLSFSASNLLTDESLISIANGLCATYTSKVQLHATSKARCQALMGTVSQVTDDTGTYDFFTADANGTVSLADFITQTKGWTLA